MSWWDEPAEIRTAILDAMRGVGDPDLEGLSVTSERWLRYINRPEPGRPAGANADMKALWERANQTALINPDKVDRALALFAEHANEICGALLLAALPQAYASPSSQLLYGTGRLRRDPTKRIHATAQFLLSTMMRGQDETPQELWAPHGRAWRTVARLRVTHAAIRQATKKLMPDLPPDEQPINQEDLVGMLLSFTVTTFEVLERFGITWSADSQDAYVHLWGVIGHLLGIGSDGATAAVSAKLGPELHRRDATPELASSGPTRPELGPLVPTTPDQSRTALAIIRQRQWLPVNSRIGPNQPLTEVWRQLRPGRVLTRALLDELEAAMPPGRRGWPLTLMRTLNEPIVVDRLALGGGGLLTAMVGALPRRRTLVGPFTHVTHTADRASAVLRIMSNEVTRHLLLDLLEDEDNPLQFPGLEEWTRRLVPPPPLGRLVASNANYANGAVPGRDVGSTSSAPSPTSEQTRKRL